jgi:hypothetical protein
MLNSSENRNDTELRRRARSSEAGGRAFAIERDVGSQTKNRSSFANPDLTAQVDIQLALGGTHLNIQSLGLFETDTA